MVQVFDPTKPTAGPGSPPVSADIRQAFSALQYMGWPSWVADGTFLIWPTATSLAHWATKSGSVTLARETSILQLGPIACKMTAGGATARFGQALVPSLATAGLTAFRGREFSFGSYLRSSSSNVRVYIDDGVTIQYPGANIAADSIYHWNAVTKTLDAAATKIEVGFEMPAAAVVYASGPTGWPGAVQPQEFAPCPTFQWNAIGTDPSTITVIVGMAGGSAANLQVLRPGIVVGIQASCNVAPTGADLIFDVLSWDGAAYTTMCTTKPRIVATQKAGATVVPDGTYERRCLVPLVSAAAALPPGTAFQINTTQIGSTVSGQDACVQVCVMSFARPQQPYLAFGDFS